MKVIPHEVRGDRWILQRFKHPNGEYGDPHNGAALIVWPLMRERRIAILFSNGEGWDHVSASLVDRVPTWQEMCLVKDIFFEPEDTVLQFHPARKDYVNLHPFCLHLWKPHGQYVPTPPVWMLA